MTTKYNQEIQDEIIIKRLQYLLNQVYKLLPSREEGIDWEKPLETIIEEINGMNSLFNFELQSIIYPLLCKIEGLYSLKAPEDFSSFRRTIFECLNLIGGLVKNVRIK